MLSPWLAPRIDSLCSPPHMLTIRWQFPGLQPSGDPRCRTCCRFEQGDSSFPPDDRSLRAHRAKATGRSLKEPEQNRVDCRVEQRSARVAHNHEVVGSNPTPAISRLLPPLQGGMSKSDRPVVKRTRTESGSHRRVVRHQAWVHAVGDRSAHRSGTRDEHDHHPHPHH